MKEEIKSSITRWVAVVLILAVVGFFLMRAPTDPPTTGGGGHGGTSPFGDVGGSGDPLHQAVPGEPSGTQRCAAHGPSQGYHIAAVHPEPQVDAEDEEDAGVERLAPFAVELGRGVHIAGGFAVGVKHDAADGATGSELAVALLDERAEKGEIVKLGRTRGDLDAPLVAPHPGGWVAAMLEPDAGGLSLRMARKAGDELDWGAELQQGRDESLAYDIAFGERVGVVAWDDVSDDGKRAMIMLTTVATESLEGGEDAAAMSDEATDADLPRVVPRDGGFWLAWVARARVSGEDRDKQEGDDRDRDGRFAAERILHSWLELMPLDAAGKATGPARAVTAKDGHVMAYDLATAADGGAFLTWRDDDTPSGAEGGSVRAVVVSASGGGQEELVADDDLGAGVPALLGQWIALPGSEGMVRVAPLAPDGQLRGALQEESLIRFGQLVAGAGDVLLIARPDGKAVQLFTVKCDRSIAIVD